jgi:hypothetical protein
MSGAPPSVLPVTKHRAVVQMIDAALAPAAR